jgi:hypothetical protein
MSGASGQPEAAQSGGIARWHTALRAMAVLNAVLWSLAALALTRHYAIADDPTGFGGLQLLLCAAYVAGCAFRSVFPVIDIPRIVLVDSRLSSVFIGRSVATVAEWCFAAQWALLLVQWTAMREGTLVHAVAWAIVLLITLAEVFSWYAVLTTRQWAHAVENSFWGLAAVLVLAALWAIGAQQLAALRVPVLTWHVGGAAYVAFIFLYDVPMYWSRWRADQARGLSYLSLSQGVLDVLRRRSVSYRWEDWKDEVLWMTLYFSVGVWSSIWLVHASLAIGPPR